MPIKRQSVPFQHKINTDAQWERMIQLEGLIVVDVYAEWCGPCAAMLPTLKGFRPQSPNKLHFAKAKSDSIKFLEKLRGKSEPTWLFVIDGHIVNVVYGASAPKLIRTITNELKNEKDLKKGKKQRSIYTLENLPAKENVKPVPAEAVVEEAKKTIDLQVDEDFVYKPF